MRPGIPVQAPIVSVVILRPGPEILLMRRVKGNAGTWCQVAGKVEPEETGGQAARRELREETGFVPESLWSADICEQFYEPRTNVITMAPVFVAWVSEGADPVFNEEHDAHRWLSVAAAIDLVSFGGQRRMLREIDAEFIDRTPTPHLRIALT
ncbi:MAG: NUDIX domain-containing protein [Pseudomonadota bacterium]